MLSPLLPDESSPGDPSSPTEWMGTLPLPSGGLLLCDGRNLIYDAVEAPGRRLARTSHLAAVQRVYFGTCAEM